MKIIKAIRAATNVDKDSPFEIQERVNELLNSTLIENSLTKEDIISVYFTVTQDIRSFNPARVARERLEWNDVCMICAQEAFIEGGLDLCIRALLHVYSYQEAKIKHVYLHKAQSLRTDWSTN
ncbi:MAG: chorismate mutase [Candidatus Caenarcaniphilales bacterium]|nr:chorismate mutase [Candidatus Caenarcaniphilales bacterium]